MFSFCINVNSYILPEPHNTSHFRQTPVYTARSMHMPVYGPAFTGTQCTQGWPGWVDLDGWLHNEMITYLPLHGHLSKYEPNPASITLIIRCNMLTTTLSDHKNIKPWT